MKILLAILISLLLASCQPKDDDSGQGNNIYPFYVGTYTNDESEGIYKFLVMGDGSLQSGGLVAKTENPAYLTMSPDKKYLLAVNEIDEGGVGAVESYHITKNELKRISRRSSGGTHPCFVAINEEGFVLATNWTGGNVGLLRLDKNGELSQLLDLQTHSGSSIGKNQKGPHAHSAWFESGNNNVILVDLGTNELWLSKLDTTEKKLLPSDPQKLAMKPGAGPRHLVLHPNGRWIYVLNELDNTVTFIEKTDKNNYLKGASVSTLPGEFTETNYTADIIISSDGKYIYATNRGHNSIVIFKVKAEDGSLDFIGHEPTRGNSPRNIALSPDDEFLVVANRHSNDIVSFKRDHKTGQLIYKDQVETPSPACILF